MATNATNHINYCAQLPLEQLDLLGAIRLWSNIRMATEEDHIWLTDLDYAQIHSLEIKSIPYIKIYSIKENKLFPLNSKLPALNYPSLLWTPIQRALKISLANYNHQYIELSDHVSIKIVPSHIEHHASCCIVELAHLKRYLQEASTVRLEKIKWAQLNNDLAFLYGTPLLPLPGTSYYRTYDFLIPCGFELELHTIQDGVNEKINPDSSNWVLWRADHTYALIEKQALQDLSRSSFKRTAEKLSTD